MVAVLEAPQKVPSETRDRRILLANPRGFCAGVVRAIDIVELAVQEFGAPVYVRKEIVHNRVVVNDLRSRGVIFVDTEDEVPAGGLCIFSAHGVSPEVRRRSRERGLRVIDATCPLVTKVHLEVQRFRRDGLHILLVGHEGHEEIEGTRGEAPDSTTIVESAEQARTVEVADPEKVATVSQTTLSFDDTAEILDILKSRFPSIRHAGKSDICYATQNRQDAVKKLARQSDLVLIVGNENSSNSQRLVEVARSRGVPGFRITTHHELQMEWLEGVGTIGVSSGASTPESSVQGVVDRLLVEGWGPVEEVNGIEENVTFPLPRKEFDEARQA